MRRFFQGVDRPKDSLAERLEVAARSGTAEEVQRLCGEAEDWKAVLIDQASGPLFAALERGDHGVIECLLQGVPAWAWTQRGMREQGDDATDGNLGYATSESVSSEMFQRIVEVLGKECLAFEPIRWSRATEERAEEFVAILGEVARSAEYSEAAREAATQQLFDLVDLNSTYRGNWPLNRFVVRELQRDGGDAFYEEQFAKAGGWTKIVSFVARHPADEPLDACLKAMRDKDLAQVGAVAIADCFCHSAHVLEGVYEKFPREAWSDLDREGDPLLFALCAQPGNAGVARYMIDILGIDAVRRMSQHRIEDEPHEGVLHLAVSRPPANQESHDGKLANIQLLLELDPSLASMVDDNGDTALHYLVRLLRPGPSLLPLREDRVEIVQSFCLAVASCYPRDALARRNKNGATAKDIVAAAATEGLLSALTVPVKSATTT